MEPTLQQATGLEPLERFESIETPEQIGLDVELAGVGSRFSAYAIDLLWQSVAVVAAGIFAVGAFAGGHLFSGGWPRKPGQSLPHLEPLAMAVLMLVLFAVNFGYFAFFEIAWRGQSPGKRLFGLRVIQEGGFPLTVQAALLRNLLRVVDSLPGSYVVGCAVAWLSPRGQRLGDLAARTLVVREARVGEPPFARAPTDSMAASVKALVADYWAWQARAPADGGVLAEKVAAAVASRRGEPRPADPVAYLEQVARGGPGG